VKLSFKQRLRSLWQKLLSLNASPEQIAGGFAIGMFASCFPILPFDTPVAIGLAWLCGLNVIAAVTATSITVFVVPVIPFVWWAAYHVGRLIIPSRHAVAFRHAHAAEVLKMGWGVYSATLVGSVAFALPIALLSYVLIKRLVTQFQSAQRQSAVV
jgi:uncharacterized protein